MRVHRQTLAFSLGCLIVVLIAAIALGQRLVDDDAPGWLGKLAPGSEPRTVLVIVVQDRRAVWSVLAAVDGDRIVAASPEAFALRDRRIVSASFDAVGPLLSLAGWRDEPMEIVAPSRAPAAPPPPVDRVAALVNKPRLTLLESRALLSRM